MTGTTFDHLPPSWRLASLAVRHSHTVLLHGLPGTGKSYGAATITDHPSGSPLDLDDVLALTLHEDASASDVIGGYLPIAGKWTWRDGPAVQAWRTSHDRPVRLVLNELDQAAGPVLTALYAILDSPASARLTLPTGETIRPNVANLQVVSTMNGEPGDLPPALYDRHTACLAVNDPHPDNIGALPEHLREAAAGLTSHTARSEQRGTTPREWHSFAALTAAGLTHDDAGTMVWQERAQEVLQHLAILAVSPADREPEEESDEPEYGTMAWHLSRVADGEQSQYLCPDCNHLHDNDEDTSDNTVQCPDCGEWNNAEESRQDACEHHA